MTPFLRGRAGRPWRLVMLAAVLALIAGSLALVGIRSVVLKMLPFDNKSEVQVVVDMPEGTPLEQTQRVLDALADHLETVPEVTNYQTYAGTSAPINFNGLVRQYYLRGEPHHGDIQVNLSEKHDREQQSHDIALSLRQPLQKIGKRFDANVKIIEVPPGPPVLSPIVAEIYGLDYDGQLRVAGEVRRVFESEPGVMDVDDTVEAAQSKLVVDIDRERAARLGISQHAAAAAVDTVIRGEDASYLHSEHTRYPIPVRLEFTPGDKANLNTLRGLRVQSRSGLLVPLGEFASLERTTREQSIYHKDLLPVVYVTGDMAGEVDSPLYGMFSIAGRLSGQPIGGSEPLTQHYIEQPDNPYRYGLKWDGEWQITYETFRDMGIAYSVGLILIYLLIVAEFRSYAVPLIIMAPIPLTLIGIMPGHALLGREFTATSMIGMIALAGIIVRNSILLVDFVQQELRNGRDIQEAVIRSAAVRARPIALTAVAAMMGGVFILDDPIFSGLAVSLIFGLFVSTVLTLIVIPVVFYAYHYRRANIRA